MNHRDSYQVYLDYMKKLAIDETYKLREKESQNVRN